MSLILDGKAVAAALQHALKARSQKLYLDYVFPVLATVRVGESKDAVSYEKGLLKAAKATGVRVRRYILPEDVSEQDVAGLIAQINADPLLSALLLLRPMPAHMDEEALCALVAPQKDVDCLNQTAAPHFIPCTAESCLQILDHYGIDCRGKHAVILGRSRVVGLPVSKLLLDRDATITLCHSKTQDTPALARQADILIAAMGRMGLVGRDYLKPGAVVLDVGIHLDPVTHRLRGDVDAEAVSELAGAITPVPGGVGSVTTAVLAKHVVEAAQRTVG